MPDYHEEPESLIPPSAPPRGRPLISSVGVLLAWVVIIVLTIVAAWLQAIRPAPEEAGGEDRIGSLLVQMQARYLVGAAHWAAVKSPDLAKQADALNTGPPSRRWRYIIVVGELAGPKEALAKLDDLNKQFDKHHIELNPHEARINDILHRLYRDYAHQEMDAPSIGAAEREVLRRDLGWFGDLALAPAGGPDPATRQAVMRLAHRTVVVLFVTFALLGLLGFSGLIGLLLLATLALTGQLRSRLGCGSPFGGIYAETFAVWMVLFLGFSFAGARLGAWMSAAESRLLVSSVAALLSLVALGWPVLRGVPWRQVRQEIGLTAGRPAALEPILGVGCYAMALPLLAAGLAVTLVLIRLQHQGQSTGSPEDDFTGGGMPAHPIIELLARPDWWVRLQVLLLASVVAPLVEETMFRGVLYRHLREASVRLGTGWSFLLSATVVSFLFAVVHPQGLTAVPALMGLAFGLTVAREWRGTLVPGMVAHGINNGLLMILLVLAMGD
jgi:membrane protease YdiL (CAAX protease family)